MKTLKLSTNRILFADVTYVLVLWLLLKMQESLIYFSLVHM